MTCKHDMYWWMSVDGGYEIKCPEGEALYRRCCYCKLQLPLGPARLDGEHAAAVASEMRAAEVARPMTIGDEAIMAMILSTPCDLLTADIGVIAATIWWHDDSPEAAAERISERRHHADSPATHKEPT